MATSRPIRQGDRLTRLYNGRLPEGEVFNGGSRIAQGDENRDQFVLQSDFGLTHMINARYRQEVCVRVFGISDCTNLRDHRLAAAITNGTAPGLYVREGDDTSDWETYRQVLARRVEEAMAARRGGEGGVGVGETTTTTATARWRDDEIRVGDVVEVVSCKSTGWTTVADVGTRGRVTEIDESVGTVHLESYRGQRLPQEGIAGLADVRKVSSPSPQNTTASVSPMSDQEAARIATTVADEVRRGGDETTAVRRVVNPVPPTAGVYIGPATIRFDDRAFTGIITATGPLRRGEPPVSSPPTTASSRFSLLEVDLPPEPTSPISRSLDADLAALQEELRVERERNRAQAAAQMQKTRFDLLECDLPAVPATSAVATTAATCKASSSRLVTPASKTRRDDH